MFKAVISDVNLLKNTLTSIAEIVDEVVLKISEEGISIRAADRAMVAAVDLKLSASAFDSFEVSEPLSIGVNLENLISILKRASVRDRITLNLKNSQLEILIQNSGKRRFLVPLLEITQEEVPQIEQLKFTASIELSSDVLESGIKDASIVSDVILFEALPNRFFMIGEGDISKTELELEKDSLESLKVEEEAKARYPLDYLNKMIKAKKIAEKVRIEFGKDYPLKLTFQAGDKCTLSFVLAPRVIEE